MNPLILFAALLSADPHPETSALLKTFRDEFLEITPGKGKFPAEATIGEGKTTLHGNGRR